MMQFVKSNVRHVAAFIYNALRLHRWRHKGKVAILMYHRVLPKKNAVDESVQPGMYVTPDVFDKQMSFLRENFQILSFHDLLEHRDKLANVKTCYCAITFDDGWVDNYVYAYPILKKYGIPATIFIPTAFVGQKKWFWQERFAYLLRYMDNLSISNVPLKYSRLINGLLGKRDRSEVISLGIERLKDYPESEISDIVEIIKNAIGLDVPEERVILNWDEIREMSKNAISFGSHTKNHRILTKLPLEEVKRELKDSMQILVEQEINFVPVLAYPNGNYDKDIQALAERCGYHAAVTTQFGFEDVSDYNHFGMKRIGIHNDISYTTPLFSLHLSGLYHAFMN